MDIGLIGFGGVGQAFIRLVYEKNNYLLEKYNLKVNIKYIINSSGGIYDNKGIDLKDLINYLDNDGLLKTYKSWDKITIDDILKNKDIETIVELTHTNIINGEPGLTHIEKALSNKINVVTGNKGPILLAHKRLNKIAQENGVSLMVGCTTGGALPSINGGIIELAGSKIKLIEGILNGTTNYILTEMLENNISYEEALKDAQRIGIAEKDPTLDVEGYDTAIKTIILANTILDTNLSLKDIEVEGITTIDKEEMLRVRSSDKKLKLIGIIIRNENNDVTAKVKLCEIHKEHPLYYVDGKNKGITYNTDSLGDISIVGGASGTLNAAASILRDLINMK